MDILGPEQHPLDVIKQLADGLCRKQLAAPQLDAMTLCHQKMAGSIYRRSLGDVNDVQSPRFRAPMAVHELSVRSLALRLEQGLRGS